MPEIASDPSSPSCSHLFSGSGIEVFQGLAPDPFSPRARDARWRFAKGNSGNPPGRAASAIPAAGCPARPLSPKALSDLIDRKPHLLRPLAEQLLPRPASIAPAERLGVDLNSVSTAEDCRPVLGTVLAAIARGELAPAEGARIARSVRARLRAVRRLAE